MNTVPTTKVVGIINFHGLTLWVIEHEGIEYIYAKPLVDLAGIDWRSAKKTIYETDSAILYGSKWITHPVFTSEGGTSTPSKEGLYIRLDRARMYLARINTQMMRGKGAEVAAESLLKLQKVYGRSDEMLGIFDALLAASGKTPTSDLSLYIQGKKWLVIEMKESV